MSLSPASLLLLQPFAEVFTRPTFCHMRTLVYGTRLASGRRTVTAALRAIGRGDERHFTTYHRVLNTASGLVSQSRTYLRRYLGRCATTFLGALEFANPTC